MNKARRKILGKIGGMLEDVIVDEEAAYDNLPDSFRDGEKGELMVEIVSVLESAREEIEDIAFGR